ncbi:hypothetical protein, partial [Pseudomonas sp. FSL R10-2964]|uniref:hypothetical protein n=1 Tax=Pseudomonas sp. FSL R10-2964 TaxID=2662202 RepID=UPI001C49B9C5
HLGLLALMAVYFTENRISWVYVQSLDRLLSTTPTQAILQNGSAGIDYSLDITIELNNPSNNSRIKEIEITGYC